MSPIQAPKGTFDVLPGESRGYVAVEDAAARILERAGYRRIETPIFEHTDLFARGVGESTDIVAKEMYSFDDGGGRSVTLRPEGTASVCRAYVEHGMHKLQQPVRLWYCGPFFRHEAPQSGRYREFHQIGAEALGSDRPELDAELILLLAELLESLGVENVRLRLGTLGSLDARLEWRERLSSFLHRNEDRLSAEVRLRIDSNPLRAFDSSDPSTQEVMATAPLLLDDLGGDDVDHFEAVKAMLDAVGVAYQVDPRLVRGLDYYGPTVFEFESDSLGAQSGLGGGGRYDGLVSLLGGPDTAAVGWAAGIERIMLAGGGSRSEDLGGDLLVVASDPDQLVEAFSLAAASRRAGLSARVEAAGRSLKAAFKHADRVGVRLVAIVGPDGLQLKDLGDGDQAGHSSPEDLIASAADKISE